MSEQEFLEFNIFQNLENFNTGADAPGIHHLKASDFQILMDRAEDLDVTILGIECWMRNRKAYTLFIEDYIRIPHWHRLAFKMFTDNYNGPLLTATFEVPKVYLNSPAQA